MMLFGFAGIAAIVGLIFCRCCSGVRGLAALRTGRMQ